MNDNHAEHRPGAEPDRSSQVTLLLQSLAEGEDVAPALFEAVYGELRELAAGHMRRERVGHTLQATAVVHEAYLRLIGQREIAWSNRRHFFGAAAKAMERLLIDHARKVRSLKRGGERARVNLTLSGLSDGTDPDQVLALHEALEELAEEDPRAAEVARLRFFVGLDTEESALALEVSPRTVARDWAYARARLFELLAPESPNSP